MQQPEPSIPSNCGTSQDLHHDQDPELEPVLEPYVCLMDEIGDEITTHANAELLHQIVRELRLISAWTFKCTERMQTQQYHHQDHHHHDQDHHQDQQNQPPKAAQTLTKSAASPVALPNLMLMQSEIEMLRSEMQLSKQEVYQRCTAQMAYLQNTYRSEHEDQVNDHQKRLDDKLHFFSQKALASIESQQKALETRLSTLGNDVRQLKDQCQDQHTRLESMEIATNQSIAKLAETVLHHRRDATQMHRQLEQADSAYMLALTSFKSLTTESVESLKANQAQLASKVQVIRVEFQEMAEDHQRKLLQLNKLLTRMNNSGIGSTNFMPMVLSMPSTAAGAGAGAAAAGGGGGTSSIPTENSTTPPSVSRENSSRNNCGGGTPKTTSSSTGDGNEDAIRAPSPLNPRSSESCVLLAKRPCANKSGSLRPTDRPKSCVYYRESPRVRTNANASNSKETGKSDCFMYAKAALSYKQTVTLSPSPYARQSSATQHRAVMPARTDRCTNGRGIAQSELNQQQALREALVVVQQSTPRGGKEPEKEEDEEEELQC